MKNIDTLIPDIEDLFKSGKELDEVNLDLFLNDLRKTFLDRFKPDDGTPRASLRMSRLGVKDRKFWYDHHEPDLDKELPKMKFLFGDIIEALMLFLAKEAGHTVEQEQAEVEIDGVKGHIDAIIDGIVIDVKSASDFAFKKFAMGTLAENDPFGYLAQISGYMDALENDEGAFWVMNKVTGQMALTKVNSIDRFDTKARIARQKELKELPLPPEEKCYQPKPYGKSGNIVLNTNCSYCEHKFKCWTSANGGKGLRQFEYSSGAVDFVEISNMPRVNEITTP